MSEESEELSNKDICSVCNEPSDYGVWVTSKRRYSFFCNECYIKKIEDEDVKDGKKVDTKDRPKKRSPVETDGCS